MNAEDLAKFRETDVLPLVERMRAAEDACENGPGIDPLVIYSRRTIATAVVSPDHPVRDSWFTQSGLIPDRGIWTEGSPAGEHSSITVSAFDDPSFPNIRWLSESDPGFVPFGASRAREHGRIVLADDVPETGKWVAGYLCEVNGRDHSVYVLDRVLVSLDDEGNRKIRVFPWSAYGGPESPLSAAVMGMLVSLTQVVRDYGFGEENGNGKRESIVGWLLSIQPSPSDEVSGLGVLPTRYWMKMVAHLHVLRQDLPDVDVEWFAKGRARPSDLLLGIFDQVAAMVTRPRSDLVVDDGLRAVPKGEKGTMTGYLYDSFASGAPSKIQDIIQEKMGQLEESSDSEKGRLHRQLHALSRFPWSGDPTPALPFDEAMRVINSTHVGLENVKDRLRETLAIYSRTKRIPPKVICLVGPPGVGKTTVAESLAKAMGKRSSTIHLGGMEDAFVLRGLPPAYIAAKPGILVERMVAVGVHDPVIILDEVDKMGERHGSSPLHALLALLDTSQNHAFLDDFLDVGMNMSGVTFVATANTVDGIPAPLLDRMEIIEVGSYADSEKEQIARQFLIPSAMKECGLTDDDLVFGDGSISALVSRYSAEAGVRTLRRKIVRLCAQVAAQLEGGSDRPVEILPDGLFKYLGAPTRNAQGRAGDPRVGRVCGLAYNSMGGRVLPVECALIPLAGGDRSEPRVIPTGEMGRSMEESVRVAHSLAMSRFAQDGTERLLASNVHIHFGSGGKDGPSAGLAIALSIISAAKRLAIPQDIGVTGEITLGGDVVAVGGLEEKIAGAYRDGMRWVMAPERCRRDVEAVRPSIRNLLPVRFVRTLDDALALLEEDAMSGLAEINAVQRKTGQAVI